MKVPGRMTYNTDKEKKRGQMGVNMRVNILQERNTVLEYTLGMMVPGMRENGLKIK